MQTSKAVLLVQANQYGGGSQQTFYILEGLVQRGYEAVLITNAANTSIEKKIRQKKLPVTTFLTPCLQRRINPFSDAQLFRFLVRTFTHEQPDMVVAAGVKLMLLSGIAGWITRVPQRVTIIRGQGSAPKSLRIKIAFALEWFLARLGTRFVTVCEYDRQQMIARRICRPDRVATVHNGTDVKIYRAVEQYRGTFRRNFSIPENAFVIGMVGRFYPQKRYDRFVDFLTVLCTKYPNVYGVFVGEGPMQARIENQISKTGFSDRMRITGYYQDMPALYADLDLSALFTDYEGCANALLESSAAGIPIIAEDICGNSEIVEHGQNGFIVPRADISRAAEFAEKLIASKMLREEMAAQGRVIAASNFDRLRQVDRLIEVIDSKFDEEGGASLSYIDQQKSNSL